MISAFLTQRTKSKFVFAGPSKFAETLFKYIAPEPVPVQYGGLSREGGQEFTTADPVTEATIKPATKHAFEFPVSETSHLVWEVRVVGWDVNYGAEFVLDYENSIKKMSLLELFLGIPLITDATMTTLEHEFMHLNPRKTIGQLINVNEDEFVVSELATIYGIVSPTTSPLSSGVFLKPWLEQKLLLLAVN